MFDHLAGKVTCEVDVDFDHVLQITLYDVLIQSAIRVHIEHYLVHLHDNVPRLFQIEDPIEPCVYETSVENFRE